MSYRIVARPIPSNEGQHYYFKGHGRWVGPGRTDYLRIKDHRKAAALAENLATVSNVGTQHIIEVEAE